jgi:S1-C subfamily serine protease
VVVDSVDKGSAAEAAGIKAGELLVRADDMKTEDVSLFQLRLQFSTETKKLGVTILLGEKERDAVFALGPENADEKRVTTERAPRLGAALPGRSPIDRQI